MINAYLDPGSGSVLVGAAAAGCAGIAVAARAAFFRLRAVKKKKKHSTGDYDADLGDSAEHADAVDDEPMRASTGVDAGSPHLPDEAER